MYHPILGGMRMHVGIEWTTENTFMDRCRKKPPTLDAGRKLKINDLVTWCHEERKTISSQTLTPISTL